MFRKPKKNKGSLFRQKKKRSLDEDDDEDLTPSSQGNTTRKNKKRFRKRSSSSDEEDDPNNNTTSGNNDEDDNNDSEDNGVTTSSLLQQLKDESKQKRGISSSKTKNYSEGASARSSSSSSSLMHEFKSSDKAMTQKELATLENEYHPSSLTTSKLVRDNESNGEDNKGTTEKPARNKFLAGPIKASKFIRTTSRFDYQPDICKDFKDTGFCGFGDSCIYLHDRTNMKTGFQLEQEWEIRKKREQDAKEREMEMFCRVVNDGSGNLPNNSNPEVVEGDDGIPFACYLCRGEFKDPIVTMCGHYFCQVCVLKRVQKEGDPTCPICKQDMNNVFNYPSKLISKKKKVVGRRGTWDEYLKKMQK